MMDQLVRTQDENADVSAEVLDEALETDGQGVYGLMFRTLHGLPYYLFSHETLEYHPEIMALLLLFIYM